MALEGTRLRGAKCVDFLNETAAHEQFPLFLLRRRSLTVGPVDHRRSESNRSLPNLTIGVWQEKTAEVSQVLQTAQLLAIVLLISEEVADAELGGGNDDELPDR